MRGTDIIRRRTRAIIARLGIADRVAVREVATGSKHFRVIIDRLDHPAPPLVLTISKSTGEPVDRPITVRTIERYAFERRDNVA